MIQHYFGGAISTCDGSHHVAKTHAVSFIKSLAGVIESDSNTDVNSYHTQVVSRDLLVHSLEPFAISDDGCVEGVHHRVENIVAIQWHPERNHPYVDRDVDLMRSVLRIRR